ncbi:MAG: RNase adaptor protein RapZ [Candidatus Aquicultor primus]|uniref:RNase adaptor protein RapZ n=1 Tax=Candidatus Aquicultor primus TaxID=1797195 RepID=A0A1F2UFC6_9ACTN|nr:MAG: RNase adaptor protein RapZ [Candidatus Aquicultor primus]HCG98659.1 RNase adapter RapZ [Actinomycetota bacterium]
MEFAIITGLSGAGRSEAIKCFEDMGFFCIDNLPPSLIPKMAELATLPGSKVNQVAVVCDVRGGEFFDDLLEELQKLKEQGITYQILFLEASDEVLVKRFKETRRRHPLSEEGAIVEGIHKERHIMEQLRGQANLIIDTSELATFELKDKIRTAILKQDKQKKGIMITIMSFGYKYGMPLDADLVIDVRFLPNPHYIEALRDFNGTNEKVRDFVLNRSESRTFIKKFTGLLAFLLPRYVAEGKTHLTIAIGCTGGKHRSVAIAEESATFLREKDYNAIVRHRDYQRSK